MVASMNSSIEIQARHYEEVVKLRNRVVSQRNLYYFIFILVASIAAVFTQSKDGVHNLLAQILASHGGVSVELIKEAVPFRVIYFFLAFCVVFALTMLCHRGEVAERMHEYVRKVEKEIREKADIPRDAIVFSLFQPVDSFRYALVTRSFLLLLLVPVGLLLAGSVYGHIPAGLPPISGGIGTALAAIASWLW